MDDIRNDRAYKGAVIFLGSVLFDGPLELGAGTTIDAAGITAGEVAHEHGGLAADVSGYSGLVKIAGGATSEVTVTSYGESLLAAADAAAARTLLALEVGAHVQAHSADLAAIAALSGTGYLERTGDGAWELSAGTGGGGSSDWDDLTDMPAAIDAIDGLTPAADRLAYYTGADTADLATLTSYARTLLDDTDAATARDTLGLTIDTHVQAHSADLAAIAALSGTGYLERTGDGAWELNAGSGGGGGSSDWDDLTDMPAAIDAIDGLTPAADRLAYYTGASSASLATLTSYARTLLDDTDAATARATLGLGTAATQAIGASGAAVPLLDGANTWSAAQRFNSVFQLAGVNSFSFTADQHNWNPAELAHLNTAWITTDATRTLTGIQGIAQGRVLIVINVGSTHSLVLAHESASSTANYRLALGADLTLAPGQSAVLAYDATNLRWRLAATGRAVAPLAGGGTGATTAAGARTNLGLGTGDTPQFAGLTSTSHIVLDNNQGYRIKSSVGTPINVLTIDTSNHLTSVAGNNGHVQWSPNGGNQGVQMRLTATSGNLCLGASATAGGTSLAGGLVVANGTAPATFPHVQLWANAGELKVADTAGNVTTLSPHADDGPPELYDEPPGIEWVTPHCNAFLGQVLWHNLTRVARQHPQAIAGRKPALIVETYAQYNARRGLAPGDAGYLRALDWDEHETQVQAQVAAERAAVAERRQAHEAEQAGRAAAAAQARSEWADRQAKWEAAHPRQPYPEPEPPAHAPEPFREQPPPAYAPRPRPRWLTEQPRPGRRSPARRP